MRKLKKTKVIEVKESEKSLDSNVLTFNDIVLQNDSIIT